MKLDYNIVEILVSQWCLYPAAEEEASILIYIKPL